MKRLTCTLFAILLLLSLFACDDGETGYSEESKAPEKTAVELVEERISALDSPTNDLKYKYELEQAEKAYEELSPADKSKVRNYDLLLSSREVYDYKVWEEKLEDRVVYSIKSKLLNPESLQIHSCSIVMYKMGESIYASVIVDYSAQNRAGGYSREKKFEKYKYYENDWGYFYENGADFYDVVDTECIYNPHWIGYNYGD